MQVSKIVHLHFFVTSYWQSKLVLWNLPKAWSEHFRDCYSTSPNNLLHDSMSTMQHILIFLQNCIQKAHLFHLVSKVKNLKFTLRWPNNDIWWRYFLPLSLQLFSIMFFRNFSFFISSQFWVNLSDSSKETRIIANFKSRYLNIPFNT